jgi:hypothetical protein
MNWNLIKDHLKNWAQELKDSGLTDEGDYVLAYLRPSVGVHESLATSFPYRPATESEPEAEVPEPFVWDDKLLGRMLVLRGGMLATVLEVVDTSDGYPLIGVVYIDDDYGKSYKESVFWRLDGSYLRPDSPSDYDIVGVVK